MALFKSRLKHNDQASMEEGSSAKKGVVEERYLPVRFSASPGGRGMDMVYNFYTGESLLIPETLTSLLYKLNDFATLEEHMFNLNERGWRYEDREIIKDALRQLTNRKLLLSGEDILRAVEKTSPLKKEETFITSIAWPTRNRPELLERGIRDFITNNQKFNRKPAYLVLDDQEGSSSCGTTAGVLKKIAEDKNITICYAGDAEKQSFISRLEQKVEDLPEGLMEFALSDPVGGLPTYGANRNAVLLAAAGELFLSLDDDMVCSITANKNQKEGISFSTFLEMDGISHFADRESLLDFISPAEEDVLQAHELLLGKTAGDSITHVSDKKLIDIDEVNPRFAEILSSMKNRVLATVGGSFGDSGMGLPRVNLMLRGESQEMLVESEETYRRAFRSREILQVPPRPVIAMGSSFPGMNIGLDNREILPPFFPVLRGEDTIFYHCLRACHPHSIIGYTDRALGHFPAGNRYFKEDIIHDIELYMSEIFYLVFYSYMPLARELTIEESCCNVGSHLREIGALNGNDFEELIRLWWMKVHGRKIQYMEESLAMYHELPPYWADDLKKQIAALREFSLKKRIAVPADLMAGRSEEEACILAQKLISRFGELIQWWPIIMKKTRELKKEGRGLTVDIQ